MDTICRRDIKLSDYNISRAKYNELKYFCIQYAEKKQKLQNAYGLKATVNDGMPKSNLSGDSTAPGSSSKCYDAGRYQTH